MAKIQSTKIQIHKYKIQMVTMMLRNPKLKRRNVGGELRWQKYRVQNFKYTNTKYKIQMVTIMLRNSKLKRRKAGGELRWQSLLPSTDP